MKDWGNFPLQFSRALLPCLPEQKTLYGLFLNGDNIWHVVSNNHTKPPAALFWKLFCLQVLCNTCVENFIADSPCCPLPLEHRRRLEFPKSKAQGFVSQSYNSIMLCMQTSHNVTLMDGHFFTCCPGGPGGPLGPTSPLSPCKEKNNEKLIINSH